MYSTAPPILVKWLRAAGEPSRLRLLALCAEGALSVSDLAHALKHSEPRVSRHLKILCEAGLLIRLRHGQWVDYRLTEGLEAPSGALSPPATTSSASARPRRDSAPCAGRAGGRRGAERAARGGAGVRGQPSGTARV